MGDTPRYLLDAIAQAEKEGRILRDTRVDGGKLAAAPVGAALAAAGVKVTEAEFQEQVIGFARSCGWKVAHFRKVRVQRADGSTYWETPVAADGKGFPDLLMLRGGRQVVPELKVPPNKPEAAQVEWLDLFKLVPGIEVFVWYPADWPLIVETLTMTAKQVVDELRKLMTRCTDSEKVLYETLDEEAEGWRMRLEEIGEDDGDE